MRRGRGRGGSQIAAIMIALRKRGSIRKMGGLRRVIGKFRSVRHVAGKTTSLFHVTPSRNIKSIAMRGLIPGRTNKGAKTRKPAVYLARRKTASAFGKVLSTYGTVKVQLFKVRVPKKSLSVAHYIARKTTGALKKGKYQEYHSSKPIPAYRIRKVK